MNSRSLLIPVAAFALTVTGVQAFNSELLGKAGLSEEQIAAFETAKELRQAGDTEAARDALVAAEIDVEVMHNLRKVMQEHKHAHRDAVRAAIEDNDYASFLVAIEGSPLAEIIRSEVDFALFTKAHELREAGELAAARVIMQELGTPALALLHGRGMHHKAHHGMGGLHR